MRTNRLIPSGLSGTAVTVGEAHKLAVQGSRSPEIITLTRDILVGAGVPERDKWSEIVTIHGWIKRNSRYTNDSVDAEVLTKVTGPQSMMEQYRKYGMFAGDCDDLSIFEAAMLRSVGRQTRFVTITRDTEDPMNRMQHIYLEVSLDGEWVPLDPIMKNRPAGYAAQSYTAKKTFDLGAYPMHLNSRIPKFSRNGLGKKRRGRGQVMRSSVRRSPSTMGDWRTDISAPRNGLGAISIFKPLKKTFIRMYGTEAEKASQREQNRIDRANAIFAAVAAGKAVPLTGADSLQYAINIYNDNHIPIPPLPTDVQRKAADAKVSMTETTPPTNWLMIGGIGLGALILAKALKIF